MLALVGRQDNGAVAKYFDDRVSLGSDYYGL